LTPVDSGTIYLCASESLRHFDSSTGSSGLTASDARPFTVDLEVSVDVLSSFARSPIQTTVDESGSSLPVSMKRAGYAEGAGSEQGANSSAALVAGLGVGLLILVLCGLAFYFFARRRDETDLADGTEAAEFNNDSVDLPDAWAEHMQFVPGDNALVGEGKGLDVPFTDGEIGEEGL
jgi:hypothetical protein